MQRLAYVCFTHATATERAFHFWCHLFKVQTVSRLKQGKRLITEQTICIDIGHIYIQPTSMMCSVVVKLSHTFQVVSGFVASTVDL